MSNQNQFQLLNQRRFLPFFCAQLLGAFNDNVFRNALILLITFNISYQVMLHPKYLTNLASALFILPFLICSPLAGQLADKFNKARLIRIIKFAEIIIACFVALGLYLNDLTILLGVLFLMGTQSAFFGPAKYSYLPQHLDQSELVGGNGLVETGTFVAIILGTTTGGILISLEHAPTVWIASFIILIACLGFLASWFIPSTPAPTPHLTVDWNVFKKGFSMYQYTKKRRIVFLSIIGISWFWGIGLAFLTQIPHYVMSYIHGNTEVATLFIALFSVGIAFGSLLCEKLSNKKIELGLVPFGAIGLTVFILDLSFSHTRLLSSGSVFTLQTFWATSGSVRLILDLFFMGAFSGFYVVPLYAIMQYRSNPKRRAQVIAVNNIFNTLFMIGITLLIIVFYALGGNAPGLIFAIGISNLFVAFYIFRLLPEFLMRFLCWIIVHFLYRVTYRNMDVIPDKGPAVLVCNHESYVDPFVMLAGSRRPIRFVMNQGIYKLPILNFFAKYGKAIPITSAHKNPKVAKKAFKEIAKALKAGELVCIFPEGGITRNGNLQPFRSGILKVIEHNRVPVIPLAVKGLWGSFFSYHSGKIMRSFSKHIPLFYKVTLSAGEPIPAEEVTLVKLEQQVQALKD